jgi:HTH-type transcriptional regulator, quorum sensing regulator NprR
MPTPTKRRSHVAADRPLARRVGARLRQARTQAGLTQSQLAEGRYTKAYVSALENGLVKPSMAAMHFFADRLQVPIERLLSDREQAWTRLEADLRLASGDWQQAVDAFSELLETSVSERVRAELLLGLAEGLSRLGRGKDAVRAASESLSLFQKQRRPAEAAWATYWQASGLYELEQGDQAAVMLTRLLDEIAGGLVVDPDLPVRALIALAVVATRDEQPERALAFLEQARSRVGELDERKHAMFLFSLALSYRELGDFEGAIATGMQSLAMFRAADAELEAASIQNELALVYLALGSFDVARSHAAEARAVFDRRDDSRWLAHVTETEGQIALASGSPTRALELSEAALALAGESGDRKAAISSLLLSARANRALGSLEPARLTLERAASMAQDHGRRGEMQLVLGELSDVLAELGDLAGAYAVSRRALNAGRT